MSAGKVYVLGFQFGPHLVVVGESLDWALSELDERFGERVEPGDTALADYVGSTDEERIESAIGAGDARYNDGGTFVWVDHYEWLREYDSVAAAREHFGESLKGAQWAGWLESEDEEEVHP